jgi:hypothetical protein
MEAYGQATFAMMCMEFDAMFDAADNEYIRYIDVMQLIAGYQTPRNMQLGCVWLDGHNYGDRSVEWLAGELARIRQGLDK